MHQQDSDDDFQQPTPLTYNDRFIAALANLGSLRDYSRPAAKRRRTQKDTNKPRGPKPTIIRLKLYLVPDGSSIPKFTRDDPLITTHQSHGYGYPASLYKDDFKAPKASFPLESTSEEFKEAIRALYPKLANKEFTISTIDNNKRKTTAPFQTTYFKESRYAGYTIIQISESATGDAASAIPSASTRPSASARPSAQPLPSTSESGTHNRPFTLSRPLNATTVESPRPITLTRPAPWTPEAVTSQAPLPPPVTNFNQVPTARPHDIPSRSPTLSPSSTQSGHNWIRGSTPDISFNPVLRLRLEQDRELAASLVADRNKETQKQHAKVKKDLERLERRRQRQIRKDEIEKKRSAALEEMIVLKTSCDPADLCSLAIVTPTEDVLVRAVPSSITSEQLHTYVEAITTVENPRLIYGSSAITRDSQQIKEKGFSGSCRIHVEEDLHLDIMSSDSEEDDMSDKDDSSCPQNVLEIKALHEFDERRVSVLSNLLPVYPLPVGRETILQDVMDAYTLNPNIVHHRLEVTFEGETALDMDGVTREMFSTVLQQIMKKYFTGHSQKVPVMNHFAFRGVFETIGRILSHSIVLCKYFPPDICPLIFSVFGSRSYSPETVISSFLQYLREDEAAFISHAMSLDTFDADTNLKLLDILSHYGCTVKATPNTIRTVLLELAEVNLIGIPFLASASLQRGLACFPLLWQGIGEEVMAELMKSTLPTAERLVDMISYQHSDDVVLRSIEERVKNHLERYMKGLSPPQLSRLLKFWTSADTLCVDGLIVAFNSNDDLLRRPMANTCSATLHISRLYLSYEDLSDEFDRYINDASSFVFDTI